MYTIPSLSRPVNAETNEQQQNDSNQTRLYAIRARQTTFKHMKTRHIIIHQIAELRLDQLAVVVRDRVLERVLVALSALAFVAASLETSPQNRYTLKNARINKKN